MALRISDTSVDVLLLFNIRRGLWSNLVLDGCAIFSALFHNDVTASAVPSITVCILVDSVHILLAQHRWSCVLILAVNLILSLWELWQQQSPR